MIDLVKSKAKSRLRLLDRARHYYSMRNKLIHERATMQVPDVDIQNYRIVVQQVLTTLFGLQFA